MASTPAQLCALPGGSGRHRAHWVESGGPRRSRIGRAGELTLGRDGPVRHPGACSRTAPLVPTAAGERNRLKVLGLARLTGRPGGVVSATDKPARSRGSQGEIGHPSTVIVRLLSHQQGTDHVRRRCATCLTIPGPGRPDHGQARGQQDGPAGARPRPGRHRRRLPPGGGGRPCGLAGGSRPLRPGRERGTRRL